MAALRRMGLVMVTVALAAMLLPQVASAHARYKSSTPGTGEVVQTSPAQVEITFTEEIQKVSGTYRMTVTDRNNNPVSSGPPVINEQDRTKMSVALAPNLPPGRYVVNWNNVSDADGDALNGAFSFYVGVQPTAADKAADQVLAAIGAPELTPTGSETAVPAVTAAMTPGASASPTSAAPAAGPSGGGGNTGLFIGIGIGVAVILVAGGGVWLYTNRKRA